MGAAQWLRDFEVRDKVKQAWQEMPSKSEAQELYASSTRHRQQRV